VLRQIRKNHGIERARFIGRFGEAVNARVSLRELRHQVRRLIGRQQGHLAACERGREADCETISVRAQVDDIPPLGKQAREPGDIPQETCDAERPPVTVSEHAIGRKIPYQRQCGHGYINAAARFWKQRRRQ
jgi:hypothetical protein